MTSQSTARQVDVCNCFQWWRHGCKISTSTLHLILKNALPNWSKKVRLDLPQHIISIQFNNRNGAKYMEDRWSSNYRRVPLQATFLSKLLQTEASGTRLVPNLKHCLKNAVDKPDVSNGWVSEITGIHRIEIFARCILSLGFHMAYDVYGSRNNTIISLLNHTIFFLKMYCVNH